MTVRTTKLIGMTLAMTLLVVMWLVVALGPVPVTAGSQALEAGQPALSAVLPAAPITHTSAYTITDLGTLGRFGSEAHGINNIGQVVGWSEFATPGEHAFLWENGVMQDLGTLGGDGSHAYDINDAGQVVGWSGVAAGETRAFLWENGVMRNLGTLGGDESYAHGINNAGQVVGSSGIAAGGRRAFLWEHGVGVMQGLGTLGGDASHAFDINDAGQVVGTSHVAADAHHAFLWQDGVMQDLGTLGGNWSEANGINNAGQVVGWSRTAAGLSRAFLWEDGVMQDLGTLGGAESQAYGINNAGQVVGWSRTAAGLSRAFLWEDGVMLDLGALGRGSIAYGINDAGQAVGSSEIAVGQWHAVLWTPASPLVFVHGAAGSYLVDRIANRELWVWGGLLTNRRHLSLRPVDVAGRDVVATEPIRSVFGRLIYGPLLDNLVEQGDYTEYVIDGHLERLTAGGCDLEQREDNPTLFIFPYDWRLDIAANAARLEEYITGCIQQFYPGVKVDILAHSMGGVLARRYILDSFDASATNLGHQVDQLITVGTPWLGAPKLIYALETGDFISGIATGENLKYALESMPGPHQLMPSQYYMNVADAPPLVEDGWDLDGNGVSVESYDYEKMIKVINNLHPEFTPGITAATFHEYTQPWGAQDDWQFDDTGVHYTHIYGEQGVAETPAQARAVEEIVCMGETPVICLPVGVFRRTYTSGDGTVPASSAAKMGNRVNYNAPNATLIRYYGPTDGGDALVEHNGLNRNPLVLARILELLGANGDQSAGTIAQVTPTDDEPLTSPAHYLLINGADSVTVEDSLGNSTAPIEGDILGDVPGVLQETVGEQVVQIVMAASGEYTVTFQTIDRPLAIELVTGTPGTPTNAIRYRDIVVEAGAGAQLRVPTLGTVNTHYDSDGNGSYETLLTPTAILTGTAASDLTPPSLRFLTTPSETAEVVTILAEDTESGVSQVYYSLDGIAFQPYSEPFTIDPGVVQTAYAFAEDSAGNRSSRFSYQFSDPPLFLPVVLR